MPKGLNFSITPDGLSLTLRVEEKGIIKDHPLVKRGDDLEVYTSLASLPEGFFKEGVRITFNYGNESAPLEFPQDKKYEFEDYIQCLVQEDRLY